MALHNQKALKAFRQQLRSNGTSADDERTQYLEAQGIKVIRIENRLLFESTNDVLDYIASFFKTEVNELWGAGTTPS